MMLAGWCSCVSMSIVLGRVMEGIAHLTASGVREGAPLEPPRYNP